MPPDATVADGTIPAAGAYGQTADLPPVGQQPAGQPPAGPAKPRRRKARLIGIIALIVVGLLAVGGGAGGLAWANTRKPTPAQVTAAGHRAYALRWRWLTAGRIFPAKVAYSNAMGNRTTAFLVGIAPQAPCASAFDAAAARVLTANRCVTVLRATYTDASRTALATVGVAVLPTAAAADSAFAALPEQSAGLLPVGFPGTIADKFSRGAREKLGVQGTSGVYLFFYAAGYADGRKTTAEKSAGMGDESVTSDLPAELTSVLNNMFAPPANPCTDREVRCTP